MFGSSCISILSPVTHDAACEWTYNGQGFEYQILAGPAFQLVFTTAGVFVGLAADRYNRRNMVVVSVLFWSAATMLTGLVQAYWELALLRFALGLR